MFQDSLLDRPQSGWRGIRAIGLALALQLLIAAGVLLAPLVWPERIPAVQASEAAL